MPHWKLVFRGDNRPPSLVFGSGFDAQEMEGPPRQNYSLVGPDHRIYSDFDPSTAVCTSADIEAAVIFPQNAKESTWVYAMGIDVLDPNTINGHANQVVSHPRGASPPIFWYARELAVKTVPGRQIVAGLQVQRRFDANDEAESFRIIQHVMNPRCPLDDEYKLLLLTYIDHLMGKADISVPTSADGFIIPDRQGGEGIRLTMAELMERMGAASLGLGSGSGS